MENWLCHALFVAMFFCEEGRTAADLVGLKDACDHIHFDVICYHLGIHN